MRRIKFKALQELQTFGKLHLLTAVILATAFIIFTTVTVRGDEDDEYDLSPYTTIIPLTAPVPALEPLEGATRS